MRIHFSITLSSMVLLFIILSKSEFLFSQEATDDYWIVSIPNLELRHRERVVAFEVTLTAARIVSPLNIPLEWYFSIDNESWRATMRGGIVVGAAAVDETFFKDFLIIERLERLAGMSDTEFDIQLKIITTVDFENAKTILLGKNDLLLQKRKVLE